MCIPDSTEFSGMALVAGLVMLEILAAFSLGAGGNSAPPLSVKCNTPGGTQPTEVTAANTTLQVTCSIENYTIEPAAAKDSGAQQVYDDAKCESKKPLASYCSGATGKSLTQNANSGLELTIPTLPPAPQIFYLQCKAPEGDTGDKNCLVKVSVNAAAGGARQTREGGSDGKIGTGGLEVPKNSAASSGSTSAGGVGGAGEASSSGPSGKPGGSHGSNNAVEPGAGNGDGGPTSQGDSSANQQVPSGGEVPGGTAGVQTCESSKSSITIRIPEQGSMAKFACESGFHLYPSPADKVFSKDCKTQETLKDMTRTETSAPASPPAPDNTGKTVAKDKADPRPSTPTPQIVYTLEADKKPSKRKLCYLCAKQGVSETKPGPAENYCIIYVESGARTQLGRGLTFALVLPCLLAVLYFT